jgi:hypothetical protein
MSADHDRLAMLRHSSDDQGRSRSVKLGRLGAVSGGWLLALAMSGVGSAQESFPNHPVRVVNPYSAGSVADVFGRIVTQNMAAQWNASIILESKSGANGSLAAEDVARSAPDGYTWLLVTTFLRPVPRSTSRCVGTRCAISFLSDRYARLQISSSFRDRFP